LHRREASRSGTRSSIVGSIAIASASFIPAVDRTYGAQSNAFLAFSPTATADMISNFAPGAIVRHPTEPGWGDGMVQSAIGNRVTVNFEHAGKRIIDVSVISLKLVAYDERE
jgi:hypothetical protein